MAQGYEKLGATVPRDKLATFLGGNEQLADSYPTGSGELTDSYVGIGKGKGSGKGIGMGIGKGTGSGSNEPEPSHLQMVATTSEPITLEPANRTNLNQPAEIAARAAEMVRRYPRLYCSEDERREWEAIFLQAIRGIATAEYGGDHEAAIQRIEYCMTRLGEYVRKNRTEGKYIYAPKKFFAEFVPKTYKPGERRGRVNPATSAAEPAEDYECPHGNNIPEMCDECCKLPQFRTGMTIAQWKQRTAGHAIDPEDM